jgi:hypothetical protein
VANFALHLQNDHGPNSKPRGENDRASDLNKTRLQRLEESTASDHLTDRLRQSAADARELLLDNEAIRDFDDKSALSNVGVEPMRTLEHQRMSTLASHQANSCIKPLSRSALESDNGMADLLADELTYVLEFINSKVIYMKDIVYVYVYVCVCELCVHMILFIGIVSYFQVFRFLRC